MGKNNKLQTTEPQEEKQAIKQEIKGIITNVSYAPDSDCKRLIIETNTTFETIDTTGKHFDTNAFGISTKTLLDMCQNVPELKLAKTLAMGANVNGLVFALVLRDCEFSAVREFKAKGDAREVEGQTYTNDCFKTTEIKIGKKTQPLADIEKPFLLDALKTPLQWKKSTTVDVSKLDFE